MNVLTKTVQRLSKAISLGDAVFGEWTAIIVAQQITGYMYVHVQLHVLCKLPALIEGCLKTYHIVKAQCTSSLD